MDATSFSSTSGSCAFLICAPAEAAFPPPPSGSSTTCTLQVPIERAHMEEDAGKLTHVGGSTGRIQGAEYSLVDYNRAGVPLVEIVTKPIFGTEERAPEVKRALSTLPTLVAKGVAQHLVMAAHLVDVEETDE